MNEVKRFRPAVGFEDAGKRARLVLEKLSLEEKVLMIGGHNNFFTKGFEKYEIPELYFSDATQGIHIRKDLSNQLEKSTAFPCPICLSATWNPDLAYKYAEAIGQECRAGGIAVLLGPGMNIYRISQCGRNFEYFGEDPYLASKMIENYVTGLQSTGTIATMKHFVCNNTDYRRRTSNSVVDERTLHEIYLPAFKAGVDAGAMAVMTSYNMLNGEWTGQSEYAIKKLLREDLGFKWLVMTDWWSVYDPEKVIKSGMDLEMPGDPTDEIAPLEEIGDVYLKTNASRLLEEKKITEEDIDRMVISILRTTISMGLHDRPVKDESFLKYFPGHKEIALQTAREGIVLLRNENKLLPVKEGEGKKILLTGDYANIVAKGGGSADVEGYDLVTMFEALQNEYGENINFIEDPSDEQISDADIVIVSIGTNDNEGWDKPFNMPELINKKIIKYSVRNSYVIVIVNSGGGINMTLWNDKVAAVIYSWYTGQNGNTALAEIISGKVNPSGKLPVTIEKDFKDSPGFGYLPDGEELYEGWDYDMDMKYPVNDINYSEGVFVGYRWYEAKHIEPLYNFGHGLSYSSFEFGDLKTSGLNLKKGDGFSLEFTVKNSGKISGAETAQLYISDIEASVQRPVKELKWFSKIFLDPGESKKVKISLEEKDFAYWDVNKNDWAAEPGEFKILIGSSSSDIRLVEKIKLSG